MNIEVFLAELNEEAVATRKILNAFPSTRFDWQPHQKSMSGRALATHIAELPTWIHMALTTDELDFASSPYRPSEVNSTGEVLALLEKSLAEARTVLVAENEKKLAEPWTLRSADVVYSVKTKAETIRHALNQIIHHRAQLGVYLRLLDIPVPSTYGPSADDPGM
ncbi:MAG: DinB family protein [Flavobacterium sp.]|nr:DinB family protein [Flavobacterium sp.]